MSGGPALPSKLPRLATSGNLPVLLSNQEAKGVPEPRAEVKKQEGEIAALNRRLEPVNAAPPARSSVPTKPTSLVTQVVEQPVLQVPARAQGLTMGWSALPPELEEHILCSLPLLELARASTTCRAFNTCFRARMAAEEEARSDMAAQWFGGTWITCIAGLVDRYLKGELGVSTLKPSRDNYYWISDEGVLEGEAPPGVFMDEPKHKLWPIEVRVNSHLWIDVPMPNGCSVHIWASQGGERVWIDVTSFRDEDVEGMAFVQALLTWGLPTSFRDAHPHISVELDGAWKLGPDALFAQVLPLLALASRHKWRIDRWTARLGLKSP